MAASKKSRLTPISGKSEVRPGLIYKEKKRFERGGGGGDIGNQKKKKALKTTCNKKSCLEEEKCGVMASINMVACKGRETMGT